MLLRRITKHVKDQNWFAVALDFVIVVAGILLALQVSNWNSARLEREIERDMLIRLHADIQESIAGQTRDLNFLRQQLDDQQVILDAFGSCRVAPDKENDFQRGLATLGWINPPRLFRRTIDEVTASGRTDVFTNPEVAEELARIVALVEWRAAWFDRTTMVMADYRRSIEPSIRYQMDRTLYNPFVSNHRGGVDYDIGELCGDDQIANAISAASYVTSERLEAYRPILDAYISFAPMIEEELRTRWGADLVEPTAE